MSALSASALPLVGPDVDIRVGDVLEQLALLPDESVHCVITSPPYLALRDYGLPPSVWGGDPACEHQWGGSLRPATYNWQDRSGPNAAEWDEGRQHAAMSVRTSVCRHCGAWRGCLGQEPTVEMFVAHLVLIFREVWRVLRKDGVLFVNLGDSHAGSGKGPTGHNGIGDQSKRQGFTGEGAKRLEGRALGAIPSTEERRAGRGIRSGKGYELNDGVRVPGRKPKDLMLVPELFAIEMQRAGWWVRSRIAWGKTSAMPESVLDRPTSAWEHIFMFSRSRRYFYDSEAVRQPHAAKTLTHRGGDTNGKSGAQDASGKIASGHWAATAPVRQINDAGAALRNFWLLGPEPSRFEYCYACDSFFLSDERKAILKVVGEDGKVRRICPSCGKTEGWVAHFASFVTEVPRRCVLAATSEAGVCQRCGTPWKRSVERPDQASRPLRREQRTGSERISQGWGDRPQSAGAAWQAWRQANPDVTTGWEPTCRCKNAGSPVPATVLDPFHGSGTTSLAAKHLGRRAIGIELKPEYAALSRHRVERDVPKWARATRTPKPRALKQQAPSTQPALLEVAP